MALGTVGVITLHDVANYGSCLQAYATQQVFMKLGWDSIIVDYHRANGRPEAQIRSFFKRRGIAEDSLFAKVASLRPINSVLSHYYLQRGRVFERFRRQNLILTRSYYSEEELEQDPPVADVYCTGSDQVWNSVWNEGFERPLFLEWVPSGKPCITFSASIGREHIDEWEKPLMKAALKKYSAISMREISGVKILSELGLDSAFLVLDPTLALTKDEWERVATFPNDVPERYILSYQLNPNDSFVKYTQQLSEVLGIPIVKICYRKSDCQHGAINLLTPEVTDFVGLFLGAHCVITDSFHATAFSLNFEKPFVSIAPSRFSTRIKSILELTGTENRLLGDYSDMELMASSIDFGSVRDQLNSARESTILFLSNALSANSPEVDVVSEGVRG